MRKMIEMIVKEKPRPVEAVKPIPRPVETPKPVEAPVEPKPKLTAKQERLIAASMKHLGEIETGEDAEY